jgi:twitching motility protein PilT
LFQFQAHDGAANCVAFSADGLHLATAGADHLIRVWFVQTGEMVKELSGHQDYVSAVAFSRDGKRMASCGGDGTVKIWEVTEKSAYASASSLDPGLEIEHEDTGRASLAYSSTYTAGKPVAEGTLKSGPTITLVQSGGDRVAFTAGDSTKPVVTITPNEVTVLGGPGLPYLTLAVDTLTVTFDKTDGAAAPLAGEKHEAEAGGADPNLEIERGGNEPVAGATQGLEIELETAAAPDRRYQAFERHGQALAREPIGRSGHIVRFVRFDTNTLYALLDQHEHPTLVFRGDLLDVRDGSGTTVFRMNVRSMEPVITRRSPVAAEGAAAQRPADPLVVAGVNEMVDRTPEPRMHRILSQAVWAKASDIHVPSGARVMVRKHGRLTGLGDKVYTASEVEALIYEILTPDQRQRFSETNDLDFSYEVPKLARFRANVLRQHRGVDATFRVIPDAIPSPEALGLPASVAPLCKHHNGLVLITGPAGQGKSTTIATLIDLINSEKAHHIITVEDPIEFVHPIKRAVVNQREVGRHTRSFANALRAALREDPDVIVVGEMRDLETISLAITASETGHLVFGSLMTSGAAQTIDRILDSFPSGQQAQIRTMLSESLRGVVSQQLVPTIDGEGRVLACEVLLGTPAVANMIRERKTFQLPSIMQTGRTLGMLRMDDSLFEHFSSGRISADAAITYSQDPKAAEARIRPKAGGAPAAEPAVPTPRSR